MKMEPIRAFEAAQPDLSRRSLPGLAYILRHKEEWPRYFGEWDYGEFDRCAAALAADRWGADIECSSASMAEFFSIPLPDARCIFAGAGIARGISERRVTPEMVADDIDAYHARQLAA